MNPVDAFNSVVDLANVAQDPTSAWEAYCKFLCQHVAADLASRIADVEIARDVAAVRTQLINLLSSEPPSDEIDTFYFGLFDAVDDDDQEALGYYVAGVRGFDPDDGDSLCDPEWWPDGRYLQSLALDAIKSSEVEAARRGLRDDRLLLGYAGELGAALIVSRFAVSGLADDRAIVVGFDSGDYALLGS